MLRHFKTATIAFGLALAPIVTARAEVGDYPDDNAPRYGRMEATYCRPNGTGTKMVLEFEEQSAATMAHSSKYKPVVMRALQADAKRYVEKGDAFDEGVNKINPTLVENRITKWGYYLQAVDTRCPS